MKQFITVLVFLIFSFSSIASHIMGGDIAYEYIGDVGGGLYRYKATFTVYSNCDSQSNWQDGPPGSITYAVYQEGFDASANKPFIKQQTINLSSSTKFTPDIPNGCTASIDVCIYEAKYVTNIDLPITFNGNWSNGYHLYFDVCCRNDIINNLVDPGFTGSAFYAFIPSPLVVNSSPVFSDSPLPFICVGETTPLLNTAFDPDGDLLVFSFQKPYKGYSTATNPQPVYDDLSIPGNENFYPNLVWPLPTVTWESGYSYTQPFTASGSATINGYTGYSEYTPPNLGNYVVAVEIKEYRNNNLIGITRRDMQMIVVTCPPNIAPNLSSAGSSGQTSYTIEEGANLCFDVIFNDTNGDQIELTSNGDIFNSAMVSPVATINTPKSGSGAVTANFCWDTECEQGRGQPYLFTVNATDDGCLPKTTPDVYSILVNDFKGPTIITGSQNVCAGQLGVGYSVTNSTGATYTWTVTGGTIASGQGSNSISVNWSNAASGEISVATTSQYGCSRDALYHSVNINNIPINAGTNSVLCRGDAVTLGGSPTAPAGFNFIWSPSTGLNSSTIGNPSASPVVTTTYNLTVYDGSGCSATDQVTISVTGAPMNVSNDTTICSGSSIQLNAEGGTVYSWTPNVNIDNTSSPTPIVSPTTTTSYIVSLQTSGGCPNKDTVVVTVAPSFSANAGNDVSVCSGLSKTIGGSPTGPANTTFLWSPSTFLNNTGIANPTTTPTGNVTYYVTVTDATGCVDSDTINVTLFTSPTADAGVDFAMCIEDTVQLNATGGVSYQWSPNTAISNINISNPTIYPTSDITYNVTVTSADGCTDTDDIIITVNPLPLADAGENVWICTGDFTQLNASGGTSYLWSPSASLDNDAVSNPVATPTDSTVYYITVTDANSCSSVDSVSVATNLFVPTEAGNDTVVCLGDSAFLGGNPTSPDGTSYSWTAVNINNADVSNPKAAPISAMWYYVTTTNNVCVGKDSIYVDIFSLPVVDAGLDEQICIGFSVQLNATGGISYIWDNSSNLDNNLINNPIASPADTTTFIVTATDANTCSNTDTVIVVVNPLPEISAGNDTSICIFDAAFLHAGGASTYVWSPSADLITPNNRTTFANPLVQTEYIVIGTDTNMCVNSDTMIVNINQLPLVDAGVDVWLCSTGSIDLLATGAVNYSWTPLTDIVNENTASPTVSPMDTIKYFVTGIDANSCVNIDSVTVIVNQIVPTDAGGDIIICQYDSVVIGGNPTAPLGTTYSWNPISGLNDASFANPTASVSDTTKYIVTTLNHVCNGIDSMMIFTHDLPIVDAGADFQLCIGDTATIIATGGVNYLWSPNNNIQNINSNSTKVWPIDTITYYVTVTDVNTCVNFDSIEVTVNPLPVISITGTSPICFGDTSLLIANGGDNYGWTPLYNGITFNDDSLYVFPEIDTTYTVAVTDSNLCVNYKSYNIIVHPLPLVDAGLDVNICINDSTQLVATGAENYTWSPNYNLTALTNDSTISFTLLDTTYYVSGIDINGCINIDSVSINVNPLPNVFAGIDQQICINDSALLVATGAVTYFWNPTIALSAPNNDSTYASPIDTTSYIVTGTDANTCINSDTIIVVVNPLPLINAGNDTTTCKTSPVILGNNPTGPVGSTYLWSPNTWISDNTSANPIATAESSISYYLQVTDTNSCINFDSIMVNIFDILAIEDTVMCEGDEVTIGVTTISGIPPFIFEWSPTIGLSDNTTQVTIASPEDDVSYTVSVTDNNGCMESRTIDIVVNNTPIATFEFSLVPHCEGLFATFTNNSTDADNYKWTFNHLDTTTYPEPFYLFPYVQTQSIILEAYNHFGCYDSTVFDQPLNALKDYVKINPPSVFTPNNDGMNELFEIKGDFDLAGCTKVDIFNRWGTLLYTNYGGIGWNGRNFRDSEVPEGVYFYVVNVNGLEFKGTVTLMR